MVKLFVGFAAAIVVLLFGAPLSNSHAGAVVVYETVYPPFVYHYHRHDHFFHYYGYPGGPLPGWYPPPALYPTRYWSPAVGDYGYRMYPHHHRKKIARRRAPRDPNWFYCKSPWRVEAKIAAARDWWPYYAPRAPRPRPLPAPNCLR